MTDQDRDRFVRCLAALSRVFDAPFDDDKMALYFAALADLPIAALERATGAAIRTCRFVPRPAELRALARDVPAPRVPVSRRLDWRPPPPAPGQAAQTLRDVLAGTALGRRLGITPKEPA